MKGYLPNRTQLRLILVGLWLLLTAGSLYLFIFERELLRGELAAAASFSMIAGATVYLFFGCIRGFTLIPSTTLVVAAIPFFPPGRFFLLTLIGILISSASVYLFSRSLHLDEVVSSNNRRRMTRLTNALERFELPVIIGWSFFPLAPADLICYACGILEIDMRKCLLGVAIGEGAICAIYIYCGDYLLRILDFRI